MQFSTALQALLATSLFATSNAYSVLNERANPVPAAPWNPLEKRDNVAFTGAPASVTCSSRTYSSDQINLAGSDAATRERDGNKVPNPKNKFNNNPYPHQFRTQTLAWADPQCGSGQPEGELFEFPIFTSGLFDETSADVGNDRIFFYYAGGNGVFCGLGTHDGAPAKTFNLC